MAARTLASKLTIPLFLAVSLTVSACKSDDGGAGAAGAPGANGADGANGTNGTNGTDGVTGASGASGSSGVSGASGATGATGGTGVGGATGASGTTGSSGRTGATGSSGVSGVSGASGSTGNTGPSGPWGALWRPIALNSTTLTSVGGGALTSNGTTSASPQTNGMFVAFATAVAINSVGGQTQTFTQTRGAYHPELTTVIRTDATIDQRRIWVALTSASLSLTDGEGVLATRFGGVRYSVAAGDLNWKCVSGDGAAGSSEDTGVTVTAATTYKITLRWTTSGELVCSINGVEYVKTTNFDAVGTTNLGIQNTLTTLTGVARTHRIGYIFLQQDNWGP